MENPFKLGTIVGGRILQRVDIKGNVNKDKSKTNETKIRCNYIVCSDSCVKHDQSE
jgi:hypothetical protein